MKKILHNNFFIETDYLPDIKILHEEITDVWEDANIAWGEYISNATNGGNMSKFFIQEINAPYSDKIASIITHIFSEFSITSNDYKCTFFKILPNGDMPLHVDQKSTCSFLIPITNNTGALCVQNEIDYEEIIYNKMIALNTLIQHGVKPPSEDRIIFHIGLRDINFIDLI